MVLRNATTGAALAAQVACARNPFTRAVGLLSRAKVGPDEGLWIAGCSAVHTVGMRAVIDLYFLDRDDRVIRIDAGVRPQQVWIACRGARSVVELGAAGLPRAVTLGDRLTLE